MSGHLLINEVRLGWHHRIHYGDGDSKKGQNQALDTGRGPRGRVGHELGRKSENGCWSKGSRKNTFPCLGVDPSRLAAWLVLSIRGMLEKAASGVLALLPCSRTMSTLRSSKWLRPCWIDPSERLRACFIEHSLPLTMRGSSGAFLGCWSEIFNRPIRGVCAVLSLCQSGVSAPKQGKLFLREPLGTGEKQRALPY